MTAALVQLLRHGLMADFSGIDYPTNVYGFINDQLSIDLPGTAYGYVWRSDAVMSVDGGDAFRINQGCYFSVPVTKRLQIFGGTGFIAHRIDYRGLHMVGGPAEKIGRLRYIDGCSDSLLISPPLKGDPCFNLLHFPKGINQTKHTHPTIRAGLIHEGHGWCHTADGVHALDPGKMFILYPDAIHAFATVHEPMTLTVYHPDSDFGPTHEEHPMLNRTIVDGVSAKHLDAIRTKEITE